MQCVKVVSIEGLSRLPICWHWKVYRHLQPLTWYSQEPKRVTEKMVRLKKSNKSNSTASAVQVEANLQEQLSDRWRFRQEWAFTTLRWSRFESLLAHVVPMWLLKWLLVTCDEQPLDSYFLPLKSRSRSRSAILDGKCQNLQMSQICASSYRFRDIQILNLYLQK